MQTSDATFSAKDKRLVLGFDAGCTTCSGLAERIEAQVGDRLEVRSLRDPRMEHWRERALGKDAPWAPTLVEVEGGEVRAWTGARMGIALGWRLGPVKTWRVVQALGERVVPRRTEGSEAGTRVARSATGVSRRRFLKALAGAPVALSAMPAGRALAAGGASGEVSGGARVAPGSATIGSLKRFRAVKSAASGFGSPDWGAVTRYSYEDGGKRHTVFAIPYRSPAATPSETTFLFAEDETDSEDARSIVLLVRRTGKDRGELRYYRADGTPLATVEAKDGKVETRPTRRSSARVPVGFYLCFVGCIGFNVAGRCALRCLCCPGAPGSACCSGCFACAGVNGVRCARFCCGASGGC